MEQICQFQDMHNILKKWDNSVIHRKKKRVIKKQILIQQSTGHRKVDPVLEIPLLFKTTMDLLTMGWRLIAMEKWIPSVSILWHANTMTSCHMTSIWLTVITIIFWTHYKTWHGTEYPTASGKSMKCWLFYSMPYLILEMHYVPAK